MKWAGIGAVGGAALLAALHAAGNVAAVNFAEAAGVYAAFVAACAALAALTGWASRPPEGEPTAAAVVWAEVGVGARNGALCAAAYSLLRLTVFLGDRVVPLWFVALYAAGVIAIFVVGLGAFGAAVGAVKARDPRGGS